MCYCRWISNIYHCQSGQEKQLKALKKNVSSMTVFPQRCFCFNVVTSMIVEMIRDLANRLQIQMRLNLSSLLLLKQGYRHCRNISLFKLNLELHERTTKLQTHCVFSSPLELSERITIHEDRSLELKSQI